MNRTIFTILASTALGLGIQGCSSSKVASRQAPDDMYYSGSGAAPVRTTTTETTRTTTTEYVDQQAPQQAQATTPEYYQPGTGAATTSAAHDATPITNNYYGDVYNSPGGGSGFGYTSPVGFYRPWYRPGLSIGFGYSSYSGFAPMAGYGYGCPYYYDPFWYTPPPPVVYNPWYNPYYGWGYNPYMAYYSPWYGGGYYNPYYYGYYTGTYYNGYYNNDNGGSTPRNRTQLDRNIARPGSGVVTNGGGGRTDGNSTPNRNPRLNNNGNVGGKVVEPGKTLEPSSGSRLNEPAPAKTVSGRELAPAAPPKETRTYDRANQAQYQQPNRQVYNTPAQQPGTQRNVDLNRGSVQQQPQPQVVQPSQPAHRTYYSQPVQAQPNQQPPVQQPPVQPNATYYSKSRAAEYTQQSTDGGSQSRWSGGNRSESGSRQYNQAPVTSSPGYSRPSNGGGSSSGGSRSGGGGTTRPR